jgi:phospholipid transport system substrate-binding protein
MKRFLQSLAAIFVVAFATTSFAGDAAGAKVFLDKVAADVLAIVKDSAASKDAKQKKIEALFADKVDIAFVAKFVLGKHWRAATPKQQQDYMTAYKPFILKNYASKLTKYSGQTYVLKNQHMEDNIAVVTMEIVDASGTNVEVDYRLGDAGVGKYKINDIVVEGVSLLTTQRAEFGSIVEQHDVDYLIAALQKQVSAVAAN